MMALLGNLIVTCEGLCSDPIFSIRLCVATSWDLVNWEKHGSVFMAAHQHKFLNAWTKSGSIVVEPTADGRLVAARINGLYWMYWGENDIYVATSDNLIQWEPILSEKGGHYQGRAGVDEEFAPKPLAVLRPRKGKFDSGLVEPGPPAILRDDGILLLYNSKNAYCNTPTGVCPQGVTDRSLPPGTYSAGQALFSLNDPKVLLDR
jgi:predicted GH43/DUF377 family glycosyl hydrolase